jgi:hypothetical protein
MASRAPGADRVMLFELLHLLERPPYATINEICDLWRAHFGTFEPATSI